MRVREPVLKRGRNRFNGLFHSFKCKNSLPWESQLERDFLKLLELDPEVVCFEVQPDKLSYRDGMKNRYYIPDVLVEYRTGSVYYEVKMDDKAAEPDIVKKHRLVKSEFDRQGKVFRIAMESEIRRQPRLENVDYILRYGLGFADVLTPDPLIKLFGNEETKTLGELSLGLSGDRHISNVLPYVHAGFLAVNLVAPLSVDCPATFTWRVTQ